MLSWLECTLQTCKHARWAMLSRHYLILIDVLGFGCERSPDHQDVQRGGDFQTAPAEQLRSGDFVLCTEERPVQLQENPRHFRQRVEVYAITFLPDEHVEAFLDQDLPMAEEEVSLSIYIYM